MRCDICDREQEFKRCIECNESMQSIREAFNNGGW
ncbi:hypothetical protein PBI_PEREGRIN_273 [Rhodococcus phage Peregrin]|nr:hypothetical protein PBI_PEREGRIN_273 [Rhodococcus phage Peregrin]